jgi:hypothetical protein
MQDLRAIVESAWNWMQSHPRGYAAETKERAGTQAG